MKRKMILSVISLCLLFIPACAHAEDIGDPGTASFLTRLCTDGDDLYVMGTYQSSRLWVNRYDKEDLSKPKASWNIGDTDGTDRYWAGDTAYNGAMTLDQNGNVYLAATKGTGALRQLMVFRLNGDLELETSAVFGSMTSEKPEGTLYDPQVRDIAVNESGEIFIVGDSRQEITEWTDPQYRFEQFEKYSDSGQRTGRRIGYVVKLDQDMKLQQYTYMGSGSNGGTSAINRILTDGADVYILGRDASGNIPTTDGVLQPEMVPATSYLDSFDAFIMKMDGTNLQPKIATYYGGSGTEEVADMRFVGQKLYVFGDTTSNDIPLSENAYSTERASSSSSYPGAFVMCINKNLKMTDTFAATYFGDACSNRIDAFGMDVAKNQIYITGRTMVSSAIPTTDRSVDGHIFAAVLQGDLSALRSASVMGTGGTGDAGRGICRIGDILYLAGTKGSEEMTDTRSYQPFINALPNSLAHAELVGLSMKDFVNDVQYFGAGKEIVLKLTFDANVDVTGTPTLQLNIQNGEETSREAQYVSGSGTRELIFSYMVQPGDTTNGNRLATTGLDAIHLNGGSIIPSADPNADPAELLIPTGSDNRLEYTSGDRVYVNAIPAQVISVTTDKEAGTYTHGEVITLIVAFGDKSGKGVKLQPFEGTPQLTLNSGGTAVFKEFVETAGGNDGRMLFEYKVGGDDVAETLDYRDVNALDLKGAAVVDLYGTAVDTVLPEPGQRGSLSENKKITIDNSVPQAQLVGLGMKDQTNDIQYFGAGKEIVLKLTFDANVDVIGKPTLQLNIQNGEETSRAAHYVSGSGTRELIFSYMVQPGDTTNGNRLVTTGQDAIHLNGGNIVPSADPNAPSAELLIPTGSDNRLEYTGGDRVYVNTIPARVLSVTTDKEAGTYARGEVITLTVAFGDSSGNSVKLQPFEGTPLLMLNSGGTAVFKEFVETAGGNDGRMVFEYTVGGSDAAETLDYLDMNALDLKGAVVADLYGTVVDTVLPEPGQEGSLSKILKITIEAVLADIDSITPSDIAAEEASVDQSITVIDSSAIRTVASIKKKQMKLKWQPVNGATNYRIAYRRAGDAAWAYDWSKGESSYVIAPMERKELYEFQIAVYQKTETGWVRSDWSNISYRFFQPVTKLKVRVLKGKKLRVSWKKQRGVSGYQVIYSTKKNMSDAKIKYANGTNKKKITIKKLKKGKKYFVQVRPYKVTEGNKYLGILSGKKAVRVKR